MDVRQGKRLRSSDATLEYVLSKAREIWGRDPNKARSLGTKDLEFRSFFGCGPLVFLSLWSMLITTDLLPPDGTIVHLLWTLMFLKMYSTQKTLCSLAGGVNPETFRKWTWLFIRAIAALEPYVVRSLLFDLGCSGLILNLLLDSV